MKFKILMKIISDRLSRLVQKHSDKVLHLTLSMILVILLAIKLPLVVATILTLCVGVLKEVYDKHYGLFSKADLVADILGIIIGLLIIL